MKKDSCRIYWLIFSEANLQRFSENKAFCNIALNAFEKSRKRKASVTQWVVCLKDHSRGNKCFQMVLKLSSTRRWPPIFEYLRNENDIAINFPQVTVAIFQHTGIYAKKNHLVWTTQPRSPKFERCQISQLEKKRKPSKKMLENGVNLLSPLPQMHPKTKALIK